MSQQVEQRIQERQRVVASPESLGPDSAERAQPSAERRAPAIPGSQEPPDIERLVDEADPATEIGEWLGLGARQIPVPDPWEVHPRFDGQLVRHDRAWVHLHETEHPIALVELELGSDEAAVADGAEEASAHVCQVGCVHRLLETPVTEAARELAELPLRDPRDLASFGVPEGHVAEEIRIGP